MNSLKSERSSVTTVFDEYVLDSDSSSDDSLGSADYEEHLNNLAAEKISIAQKKLQKDQASNGRPITRKMSVCENDNNNLSALRATGSSES